MRFQREISEIMDQKPREDGLLFLGELQISNKYYATTEYWLELCIHFIDTDIYKHVDLVLDVDEVWMEVTQFHPYTTNAVRTDPSIMVNDYCNIYLCNIDPSQWKEDNGTIEVRYVYVCRESGDIIGDTTTLDPDDWERVDD